MLDPLLDPDLPDLVRDFDGLVLMLGMKVGSEDGVGASRIEARGLRHSGVSPGSDVGCVGSNVVGLVGGYFAGYIGYGEALDVSAVEAFDGDMAMTDVEEEAVAVAVVADVVVVVVVENTDVAVVVDNDGYGFGFGVGMADDGRIQYCLCFRRTRRAAGEAVSRRR